jgi:serine/threonine protein kinase
LSVLQLEYGRGDVLAEKYEVVDRLDEGPLGVWYRVRHLKQGAYQRLVLLDPKIAGREQKDAIIEAFKLARKVEHPHLARVGELGQHAGVAYVTTEDFEGPTLRELMLQSKAEDRPFTLREAAQITTQILEACGVVHEAGHVLRAVRPEHAVVHLKRTGPGGKNVVYDVRLLGAGLWNLVPPGVLAEDEFTRGEASYLAPELKSVEPQASPRSDVWSAGVIFYELLVGTAPVGTYQLPRQRRPELPPHVDDVIELALAPAASDRYPTAADFIADIQRTFQGAEGDVVEVKPRTTWLTWALLAAILLAVIVLLSRSRGPDLDDLRADDNAVRNEVIAKNDRSLPADVRAVLDQPAQKNMTYIPAGPFVSGRLAQEPLDVGGTKREVKDLPGFLIDVFEYPNLMGAPAKTTVSWDEAKTLCEGQGKRLCTADEWEKACRGFENYIYGYGDAFDPARCGSGVEDVHPSGDKADCKSSWGVYDIAGNYREWTATAPADKPTRRLTKGGIPAAPERGARCAYATDLSTGFGDETLSFRCCKDLGAATAQAPADPAAAGDGTAPPQ